MNRIIVLNTVHNVKEILLVTTKVIINVQHANFSFLVAKFF